MIYQFFLLAERNLHVKISDKGSMGLLLFQAFIISLLLIVTFKGFQSDYINFDRFARTWFSLTTQYDKSVQKEEIKYC